MRKTLLHTIMVGSLSLPLFAQSNYQPSAENLKARQEFQNDKFGVFIHFGIYSMLADGEWVMEVKNIDHKEYAKLASGFCPSAFNADEWVRAIKSSGAKYITITSRHHDGFSMFDTKYSDFDIIDATPFKRDILKELAEACRKQDMKLNFYYSHLDWTRTDYPLGRTGHGTGRELKPDWKSYYTFMNNQLEELLTNYGNVGAIWFDGWWDQDIHPDFDWQLPEQYSLIHKLQPACMVGNNHHRLPYPGEDFQLFERDLPGENKSGYSGQDISKLPLETCETMNGSWGYNIKDQKYKSPKELIHYLVKAAGKNANLLMNIGPQPNGELPAVAVERLQKMGEWMNVYGETIYGTTAGSVPPREWGVTTEKENKMFVHILDLKDQSLFLPLKDKKIKKALMYKDRNSLKFTQDKNGTLLHLPSVPEDIDTVVELQF